MERSPEAAFVLNTPPNFRSWGKVDTGWYDGIPKASMHWIPIGQSLVLIVVANAAPFAAKLLLRRRFDQAIDFDAVWTDGRPLLGHSKTIRGLVLSLIITAALAPAVGLPWIAGLSIAGSAMAGDLLTSFLKRRLGMASSTSAPVIDQLAECLFPAMVCALQLGLTLIDVFVIIAIFMLSNIILGVARAAFFTRRRSN